MPLTLIAVSLMVVILKTTLELSTIKMVVNIFKPKTSLPMGAHQLLIKLPKVESPVLLFMNKSNKFLTLCTKQALVK
jgi:hypothetical protein